MQYDSLIELRIFQQYFQLVYEIFKFLYKQKTLYFIFLIQDFFFFRQESEHKKGIEDNPT